MVRGDPTLLRRMIRNLVENAQLHGEPPIEVTVERRDDRAVLNVSDRGPVIAEDARERLFSTFYRIPGRSGPQGTGLGLALVRQIARRHGGDVTYDPERGSCFTVTLPAVVGWLLERNLVGCRLQVDGAHARRRCLRHRCWRLAPRPLAASTSTSRSSAAAAKARMLATRSPLPVSIVMARSARSGDRDAAVAGRVAVAVAGRPGGAALRHGPAGREALPRGLRQQPRIRLGRGAHAQRRKVGQVEQRPPRRRGVDHGAAEEIGGRARQREQRRRDQAAGRGFGDDNGLAAAP